MKFKLNPGEYKAFLEYTERDIEFIDGMAKYGFKLDNYGTERLILIDLINHGYIYHYDNDYHYQPRLRKDE